jgi:hypothetical protein
MFPDYDAVRREHQKIVNELLNTQILARAAKKERQVRDEAIRRRRLCLVRSVLFEVLPTKVARLVAPPCVPCGAPSLAV